VTVKSAVPPARLRGMRSASVGRIGVHAVLLAASLVSVFPLVWMVFGSFKTYKDLVSSKALLPQVWTLDNYEQILTRVNFLDAFRNSVVVAVTVTVSIVITSSALGYIFAKYRFWGKEALFAVLLATMMVPGTVTMVPLYISIARMGLVNRLLGIIVTGLWSTFGIFLMRQFMESIPSELLDAARIDGASEWRIFVTVVAPMATAPMGALAVFTFLGNWNSLLWPLIILSSPERQTLPLVLNSLKSIYWTRYELWAAGSMMTAVPVLTMYAFASRFFIRGISMTGLKG